MPIIRELANDIAGGQSGKVRILGASKAIGKVAVSAGVNGWLPAARHDLRHCRMFRRVPVGHTEQVLRVGDGESSVAARNVPGLVVDFRGSSRIGIDAECPVRGGLRRSICDGHQGAHEHWEDEQHKAGLNHPDNVYERVVPDAFVRGRARGRATRDTAKCVLSWCGITYAPRRVALLRGADECVRPYTSI